MDVEIITIGDELLTGHTVDGNSCFIAERLTSIGLNVRYMSSVGDDVEDMEESFRLALQRARIVIATGGLGPTDDDSTKKGIVKTFKRNLIFHEEVLEDIKKRYALRGIEMPAINQNQALLPQGATFFPNKNGSAVGICIAEHGRVFIALPGVPAEMRQILIDSVMPYLQGINTGRKTKVIKLRTTGIVESKLAELITPKLKLPQGIKLGYLPSYGGVDLRVIASAATEEESAKAAQEVIRHLESTCGRYIYGRDDDTLEAVVGQLLIDNDKTISVAESCTGGQLGMALTSVAGSSSWFTGGVMAYDDQIKKSHLNIDDELLNSHGAVSEECAKAMADGCRKAMESDYSLSITGVAGPDGGTDDKPVGTVFIGISSTHTTSARKFSFSNDRTINRSRACYAALELLRREILDIR